MDFFSYLDESCYFMDDSGQIILTTPIIQIEGDFQIEMPIKISSNCNTVIKSNLFKITADTLYLSSITFETSLLVKDSKHFSISNCTVKNSTSDNGAISIIGCENAQIDNITIKDSQSTGLLISNSIVSINNLQIYNTNNFLIKLQYESYVTIKNSHLHHSEKDGIVIFKQTVVEITNVTFFDIKKCGVYSEDSQCTVKNCTFQNIIDSSILFSNTNDFRVENNRITESKNTAICIKDESRGTVIDNTIDTVEGNGILAAFSDVLIKNNIIKNSSFPAIGLVDKSSATLQNNKIEKVTENGICIRRVVHAELEGNEINETGKCGISISDTKSCFIHNNKINNCKSSSIEAFNNSIVTIKENIITNINENAFYSFLKSSMHTENNEINDIGQSLAKLELNGGGEFINNRILNCSNQFEGKNPSFFYFSKNGTFQGITNEKSRIDEKVLLVESQNEKEDDNKLCLKCEKNKRNYFLLPCGHKALCKECAEKALSNNENCPLCNLAFSQISNSFNVNDDKTCIICCDNQADCIILPCGHVVACSSCLKNWFDSNPICPFCRNPTSEFKTVYNDF